MKGRAIGPDEMEIGRAIYEKIFDDVNKDAARHDLSEFIFNEPDLKAYKTKIPNELFIDFEINLEGLNEGGLLVEEKHGPFLTVKGNCKYFQKEKKAANVKIDQIDYFWKDENGQKIRRRTPYASTTFSIGLDLRRSHLLDLD